MISSRAVAVEALVRIEEGAYSHVVVPTILRQKNIPVRNRAQVTSLVYATLRNQRRLDDLISRVSQRKVNRLDPPVRAALRIGAQQLISDVAPYAAVDETVSAVPQRSRGFVNAVLRSLTRLGPPWPEPESLAVALSYPDWIVDLFVAELGESDARGVLVAGNLPGVLTLRPQIGRTTAQELTDELSAEGIKVERGELVPEALLVTGTGDPGTLPAVASGRATPQDQASQAVVDYLDPQPGDRVLDVAAAPGGKTTAIAGAVGPKGFVFALDTNSGRLRLVREAALRLGLTIETAVADGTNLPLRPGGFNRILVDAPCSGLGVLRRRPDARWRIKFEDIAPLAALQEQLVLAAIDNLALGGVLVYSVCTLTKAETLGVAERVLAKRPDLKALAPPASPWKRYGPGAILLPQAASTDGMFVLGLTRPE